MGDLEAVGEALKLDRIISVHDAGGPASISFALRHPDRMEAIVLMNVFYGAAPGLLAPELIELFSHEPFAGPGAPLPDQPEAAVQVAHAIATHRARIRPPSP